MASLTGQPIQNSYLGLIKTENNGPIATTETNMTDGDGNQTGLFLQHQYGIAGYKGVSIFPQWAIQNSGFDVNASPMGAGGNTTLSFVDTNLFKTYSIAQNRFGGVTYYNQVQGQSHIFTGNNGLSPIRMDAYNSDNNSNNWYEGYNRSITGASVSGQDLTLNAQDGNNITVTLPSSGGGGGGTRYKHRTDQFLTWGQWDSGNGGNFTFFNNTTLFFPIRLSAGTLSSIAIVNHSTLSATSDAVNLSVWSAGATSSNQRAGYGGPSKLVVNAGYVDTSTTTGLHEITGLNADVAEGLYYLAIGHNGSWDTSFKVNNVTANDRASLGYVIDDASALNVTTTQFEAFYDGFSNSQLAVDAYPATYTGGLSVTSAKCAVLVKYSA